MRPLVSNNIMSSRKFWKILNKCKKIFQMLNKIFNNRNHINKWVVMQSMEIVWSQEWSRTQVQEVTECWSSPVTREIYLWSLRTLVFNDRRQARQRLESLYSEELDWRPLCKSHSCKRLNDGRDEIGDTPD